MRSDLSGSPFRVQFFSHCPKNKEVLFKSIFLFIVFSMLCVSVIAQTDIQHELRAGWNLVSIPIAPSNSNPEEIFDNLVGPLRLYGYLEGQWLTHDDPQFPAIQPASGNWILIEEVTTVSVSGELVDDTVDFELLLQSGWNIIGTPWPAPVDWNDSSVSVTQDSTTVLLSEAISQGWLNGVLYGYDPASGTYFTIMDNDAGQLIPWEAYLVFSDGETTLTFSPPSLPSGAPVASIESPAEEAEIEGVAAIIGTATDDDLDFYVLEYAPIGSEAWTEVARGTESVVSATLGELDSSLTVSGLARLRLRVHDYFGETTTDERTIQIVGQGKPGNMSITFVDLNIPVSGIPITIKRTYDSRNRNHNMDFGYGWNVEVVKAGSYANNRKPGDGWRIESSGGFIPIPCQQSVETKTHITEIRFSDTEFYRFTTALNLDGAITGGCVGSIRFEQVGGIPGASLSILGTSDFIWQNGSTELTDIDTFQVLEPQQVRLTTIDGRSFDLDLTEGLTRIEEPNGNRLTISNSGVQHNSGRSITFERDGQGRITAIVDPDGKRIEYAYDYRGNLETVTDRSDNTTTFVYSSGHYLEDVIDPEGNVPLRNEYDENGRLVAQIDADGNRTEIDVSSEEKRTQVTDRSGQVFTYNYDDNGNITQAEGGGSMVERTYDDNGNPLTETDPLGNTREFSYDENNNLLSEEDATGVVISYDYDSNDRLTGIEDPEGNTTSFEYDSNGNVSEIKDASGNTLNSFAYDSRGNLTETTSLGRTTELEYDTYGNISRRTAPGGAVSEYTYDSNGRVLSETRTRTVSGAAVEETASFAYDGNGNILAATDRLGNVQTFTYYGNGLVRTQTDENGNTTMFEYDKRGNLTRQTHPDGTYEVFGYDRENRMTAHTDQAFRTTFFDYDAVGNLVQTTYPDGTTVQNNFDAAGNLISVTNERGFAMVFEYDANGRRTLSRCSSCSPARTEYNAFGAVSSITDALGNVTRYSYDTRRFGAPRLIETLFADGNNKSQDYHESGRIGAVTDENGYVTHYDYDAAGNLVSVTDARGQVTTYEHDEAGNRIAQTDPNGNTTSMEYDAEGNLTERTLPLGQTETFEYDPAGNLIAHTDFNGRTFEYEYDSMNRRTQKILPDDSEVTYSYTATGLIAAITDTIGVTGYQYDERDRVTRIDFPGGEYIEYDYDEAGNRTSVETAEAMIEYEYDEANRLTTVTDATVGITTYSYDAAGNRTGIVYPNGVETTNEYDERNRLTAVEHRAPGGGVLVRYDYDLGPAGERLMMTESTGRVVEYEYDELYRLIQTTDDLSGSDVITQYQYDAAGNRTSMDRGGTLTEYDYDDNNRLLTAGAIAYEYDDSGNRIKSTEGTTVIDYVFDDENRLIEQQSASGNVAFIYDDNGRLVQREEGGNVERFLVDPLDYSGHAQVLERRDSSDTLLSRYVYGAQRLAVQQAGQSHYYHGDALGSTRLLTDNAGASSDTYDYDAFGVTMAQTGSTQNPFLFASERYDSDLELYYLRARHMNPSTGRFVSRDPLQGVLQNPQSLNPYVYAMNNPVLLTDPSGEFSLPSISISISISSVLSSISVGYVLYKDITDVRDKLETLLEEIPGLKLNEELTAEELKYRVVTLSWSGVDLDSNLGGGAVAKAYSVVEDLVGGTGGKAVAFIWSYSCASWMLGLPEVDDKPAHYLSCGFNDHVFHAYQLQLVNGIATKPFKPALQVIGAYLAYFNFLALMADTVDDLSSATIPEQPPGGSCPIPGS